MNIDVALFVGNGKISYDGDVRNSQGILVLYFDRASIEIIKQEDIHIQQDLYKLKKPNIIETKQLNKFNQLSCQYDQNITQLTEKSQGGCNGSDRCNDEGMTA